ncbi:S49 family peptidase [Leptospira sp. 96542]|nr:S49 family peptidase [Leptospira sp. 96542]
MKLIDLVNAPWAIIPERLVEMQGIYATHLRGEKIDIAAIEARLGRPLANDQQEYVVRDGGIAVLPIEGVIAPKANLFTRISGGFSAQMGIAQIESAMADSRVKGLVLLIDSPGGSVFGTPELAATVRELSDRKPIVAVTDGMMASAAYWIGSAANAVYASGPTVQVGSIGVVTSHTHVPTGAAQVTEITAGRYKRMGSSNKPLTEEGAQYLQGQVDHLYSVFVDAVADNRGSSTDVVLEHMADGRIFIGQQALDAGLIDGFATLDAIVEQMAADPARFATRRKAIVAALALSSPTPAGAQAEGDTPPEPVLLVPAISLSGETYMPITRESLAADAPDVLAAVQAEAAASERARVQAVRAQLLPGHEALIETLAFDGKTTGPEAAAAVLAAERTARTRQAAAVANDAPPPVQVQPAATVAAAAAEDASQPLEARCKAKWDASAKLRAEFGDTFSTYLAAEKAMASGRVKVLSK